MTRYGTPNIPAVEMLYYITMCQLTILYSFRLRLVSHLYSVDSPVCFLSSSIIIGSLISDFIRLCALSRLRRCHFRSDFRSRSRTHHWSPSRCGTDGLHFCHPPTLPVVSTLATESINSVFDQHFSSAALFFWMPLATVPGRKAIVFWLWISDTMPPDY